MGGDLPPPSTALSNHYQNHSIVTPLSEEFFTDVKKLTPPRAAEAAGVEAGAPPAGADDRPTTRTRTGSHTSAATATLHSPSTRPPHATGRGGSGTRATKRGRGSPGIKSPLGAVQKLEGMSIAGSSDAHELLAAWSAKIVHHGTSLSLAISQLNLAERGYFVSWGGVGLVLGALGLFVGWGVVRLLPFTQTVPHWDVFSWQPPPLPLPSLRPPRLAPSPAHRRSACSPDSSSPSTTPSGPGARRRGARMKGRGRGRGRGLGRGRGRGRRQQRTPI